jgi:hypothetical protein
MGRQGYRAPPTHPRDHIYFGFKTIVTKFLLHWNNEIPFHAHETFKYLLRSQYQQTYTG